MIHMWRNFHFPHNCHTWKAEISPHDNFFPMNIIRDIRDIYELWFQYNHFFKNVLTIFDCNAKET